MKNGRTPANASAATMSAADTPEGIQTLMRALSALPEPVRRELIGAADRAEDGTGPSLSWDDWDEARALVSFGGEVVDDGDRAADDR